MIPISPRNHRDTIPTNRDQPTRNCCFSKWLLISMMLMVLIYAFQCYHSLRSSNKSHSRHLVMDNHVVLIELYEDQNRKSVPLPRTEILLTDKWLEVENIAKDPDYQVRIQLNESKDLYGKTEGSDCPEPAQLLGRLNYIDPDHYIKVFIGDDTEGVDEKSKVMHIQQILRKKQERQKVIVCKRQIGFLHHWVVISELVSV